MTFEEWCAMWCTANGYESIDADVLVNIDAVRASWQTFYVNDIMENV